MRRFVVLHPTQPNGFQQLMTMIGAAFPELKDATFHLLYTDNEGDLVTMSSDIELAEAVTEAVRDQAKSIRLVVRDIVIAAAQDPAYSPLCEAAAAVTEPSPTPVAEVETAVQPAPEAKTIADSLPATSPPQGAQCPAAHSLSRFLTTHSNYFCDVCKQKVGQGTPLLGCRECDYDQCEPCTVSDARPVAQSQASEELQAAAVTGASAAVSIDEQLAQLMQLGLPIEKARRLLARFGGDVEHTRQFVLARQSARGGRGGWFGRKCGGRGGWLGQKWGERQVAPQPPVAALKPSSEFRPLQAAEGEGVHEGIFCNQCQQQPIQGARFTCTVCPDFDLCATCEAKGEHPADHPLVKTRAVPRKVQHHGVKCDGCGAAPIEGVRFSCTVCHDFDLCAACEAKGEHPPEHPLIQRKVAAEARPASGWFGRGHGRGHGRAFCQFFRHAMQTAGEQAVLASFVPEDLIARVAANASERCAMKQAKLAAKQAKLAAKQDKVADKLASRQEQSQTSVEFVHALQQAKLAKEQTNDEFKQALQQAKAQSKDEAKVAALLAGEVAELAAAAELAAQQAQQSAAAAIVAAVSMAPPLQPEQAASAPIPVEVAQTVPTVAGPYAEQLEMLRGMGFHEQSLNLYVLNHFRGDVLQVMNFYLENA